MTVSQALECAAVGSASPLPGEVAEFESRHPLEGAVASAPAVEWPSGEATACKAVHTGFDSRLHLKVGPGAISSAGERFPDTEGGHWFNPVSRTSNINASSAAIFREANHHPPSKKALQRRHRVNAVIVFTTR